MKTEDIIKLLEVLGTAATHAIDAYQKARELAASAGISADDLAAADSRFQHLYGDPLAGGTH